MDHSKHKHNGQSPSHAEPVHNHHQMMIEDFKKRFWISSLFTIPVLLLSPMIQNWLGLNWEFQGSSYLLFALASIIYFYGGYPFLKGLFEVLSH